MLTPDSGKSSMPCSAVSSCKQLNDTHFKNLPASKARRQDNGIVGTSSGLS